jgi:N-acetylglutamate synthase-like GNAT family acetyltransferase
MNHRNGTAASVRPLCSEDLDRMVVIDQAHTGNSRRRFLSRRLESALQRPGSCIHVGLEHDGVLAGFALARVLQGEFGHSDPSAALDLIGVAPDEEEHGHGRTLLDALLATAKRAGVTRLQSEADWTNLSLLGFFDATGFTLASRVVLERSVSVPFDDRGEEV